MQPLNSLIRILTDVQIRSFELSKEPIQNTDTYKESDPKTLSLSSGMDAVVCIISTILTNRNNAFFIGNGGSAAIAIHMTADFMKNGGMRTISLFDPATMTCLANDYGYEYVFSKQLERLMEPGDLLVAISSSGKSPNIIQAVQTAKQLGGQVLSLTGFEPDSPVRELSDMNIYVPSHEYGIVESVHNLILQEIVDRIARTNNSKDNEE